MNVAVHTMSRAWTKEDPVMDVSYAGRVLATFEVNGRDDSDFKALVWVPAHVHEWVPDDSFTEAPKPLRCRVEGCRGWHGFRYDDRFKDAKGDPRIATEGYIETVEYASTRGWTYPNHAEVDATPEVLAEAKASLTPNVFRTLKVRAEKQAKLIVKGDVVVNVRGRKLPKGLTGVVSWVGQDRFTGDDRISFESKDGRVFAPMKNFDPIGWERRVPSDAEIRTIAQREVARLDVRSLIYYGAF